MLPILNLGPLALPVPALVFLAGIWIAITISERFARIYGVNPSKISSLIILMLVSGLIGARLSYIFQFPDAFLHNPADILSRSPGMLDPYGGIVLALITGLIYGQKNGLDLWRTLDILTPGLAALSICIGFSHLASGNAFGAPAQLPWSIYLWGDYRHPTQMYEIILSGLLFGFIVLNTRTWRAVKPGILFLCSLAIYSAITLFVEAFRDGSALLLNTYRTPQIIAWLVLAFSLWGIRSRLRKTPELTEITN